MPTDTPLPKNSPIRKAFEKFQASEDYENAKRWAAHEQHVDGSLWAAFVAGWNAAFAD